MPSTIQEDINTWLPITSSRAAKWWYSTFHIVTVMVGAGVLALPYAMSKLGWIAGPIVLVMSLIITLYTLWQMVQMHEMVPGKRFDRYHELGQHVFGEKKGLWIVVPQQLTVAVGTDIVYMITGGTSCKNFIDMAFCHGNCERIHDTRVILIFGLLHFIPVVFEIIPHYDSLKWLSVAAAVMSVSYSTIAWGTSVGHIAKPPVSHDLEANLHVVLNFFSALGIVAFAFASHNVVLEIQASIPSTPEKPSTKPMWRGALVAYVVVAFCYFPVAFLGYWAFGNEVKENILDNLESHRQLIAMANFFVAVHLFGSYQIYALPVFDMIEIFQAKKFNFMPNSRCSRLFTRIIYVALTILAAIMLPIFSELLALLGGLAIAPTTYFLPCIMWLKIKKPERGSISWLANWGCIIFGTALMILAPIGATWQLVLKVKQIIKYGWFNYRS